LAWGALLYLYFCSMRQTVSIENQFVDELAELYDADEVRQLFFFLLQERFGWSRADYLLRKREHLDEEETRILLDVLPSLKAAVPIQYILGYAWFRGMKLSVNPSVLIPRPETEELVQLITEHRRTANTDTFEMIDIGTGSGCIAIALKKEFPLAAVYALDISADALYVARQNAHNQSLTVHFIQADILEWDVVFQDGQLFDVVVSNPPYITEHERKDMHPNVLLHEPHEALFVGENMPLLYYEHIAAFAWAHLKPGGMLYFEINRAFGHEITELLKKKGYTNVQLKQDMQGADRIVHATKTEGVLIA